MEKISSRFIWTKEDAEGCIIIKPDLDKIQCGSCVHKGAFFECPQYGDEDGLIPDDIAYRGAVCPHYQPKK